MSEKNPEIIEIRKQCLPIDEGNLKDSLSSLENETKKIQILLGFQTVVLGQCFLLFSKDWGISQHIFFPLFLFWIVFYVASLVYSIRGFFSKKIEIQGGTDAFFRSDNITMGKFYEKRHAFIEKTLVNVDSLTNEKVLFLKFSVSFFIVSLVFPLLVLFFSFAMTTPQPPNEGPKREIVPQNDSDDTPDFEPRAVFKGSTDDQQISKE
jgi:hypothetical protein